MLLWCRTARQSSEGFRTPDVRNSTRFSGLTPNRRSKLITSTNGAFNRGDTSNIVISIFPNRF